MIVSRIVACAVASVLLGRTASATNIVTRSVVERCAARSEKLVLDFVSISNEEERTRISFDLESANTPFTVYKIRWINCDSTYVPLEPFSLIADSDEVEGVETVWHISVDFPFSDRFDEQDLLLLSTDRGELRIPTSRAGTLAATIDLLRKEYDEQVASAQRRFRKSLTLFSAAIASLLLLCGAAAMLVRRRLRKKQNELACASALLAEGARRNSELEQKVDALYGARLKTLNMLCNEYFEKNGSEKIRLTLYNEIEREILALRDRAHLLELERIVDTYLDRILERLKEQIPSLAPNDLRLITYLYSGFSPRAVCIFMDLKIKNFYQRRSRLRERILASDAPDRELFASKM